MTNLKKVISGDVIVETNLDTGSVFDEILELDGLEKSTWQVLSTSVDESVLLIDGKNVELLSCGRDMSGTWDCDEDVDTGDVVEIIEKNLVISNEIEEQDTDFDILVWYNDDDALRYEDVLVYLFESMDIKLSTSKGVKFSYVKFGDANYPYFMTAFEEKMIGKTLNPKALVKCDNYLVMKWILEDWGVDKYSWTIFEKYFKAAKEKWVLNGCKMGTKLTKWNL